MRAPLSWRLTTVPTSFQKQGTESAAPPGSCPRRTKAGPSAAVPGLGSACGASPALRASQAGAASLTLRTRAGWEPGKVWGLLSGHPPARGPHGARGPRVSGKPGLPAPVLLARLGRTPPPRFPCCRVNLSLQPHAGTWLLPTQSRQTQEQSHSLLSTYDSFLEFSGGSVG